MGSGLNKPMRLTREPLFTIRTQLLSEGTPKFWEIARPDRLPHTSHGVKEEGQIVMCQQYARQDLTSKVQMTQIGSGMPRADRTNARLVQRSKVF